MPARPHRVRIAFYGDDFTGATDTLATAAQGGLRTLLFLRPPTPELLAAAGPLDCVGVAGASRSMAPAAMIDELRPVAACFAALGAPVVHYKTCSTFDSSPAVGNVAVAVDLLRREIGADFVPIVGGQPNLARFCLFGHLFAAAELDGPIFRIDRHPTMSIHPVTPMAESDLRLHLVRQGLPAVGSIPFTAYEQAPDALDRLVAATAHQAEGTVLFDVARTADLAPVGRMIWRRAIERPLVAVGPSGVTQALCAHWQVTGEGAGRTRNGPVVAADGPVLVLAGSLSPVTRRQIAAATGFRRIEVDAARLAGRDRGCIAETAAAISGQLRAGHDVIAHTTRPDGPADRRGDAGPAALDVARGSGELIARVLAAARPGRIGVAGGDTSSWALRALDAWGLSFVRHLVPGVALCRMRAADPRLDGLEVMLKGGQMGPPDLFDRLRGR